MLFPSLCFALEVIVTAEVPDSGPPPITDTTVTFQGKAYPSSTVTIYKDTVAADSILAQISSDSLANFDVTATVDPGTYTFYVRAKDPKNRTSKKFGITPTLSEGASTTISGIFLPPTLAIADDVVTKDQDIIVRGYTVPSAKVKVLVDSTTDVSYKTTSKKGGKWNKLFEASDLDTGWHIAYVKAVDGGDTSDLSKSVSFKIKKTGTDEEDEFGKPGDMDCDGYVNLTDFSILLYDWGSTDPANPRSDINEDGIVDAVDFSIMLFYWDN